jgi:DNA-binding NarL/FixJ family response regulator
MELDANTMTALLAALGLAPEGLPGEVGQLLGRHTTDAAVSDALALGFLAGRIPHRPRARRMNDPTAFVIDRDLVVQGAVGESIMRLPWLDEGLFVGRQLHDISEVPDGVRKLSIENYSAALAGERCRFAFTSYGHAYSVEALPLHGEDGIEAVLAIATPSGSFVAAAMAYEKMAERLDRSATHADERAERHRQADRSDAEAAEIRAARKSRDAAERARANARRLRARHAPAPADPPSLTARETEVLSLASHGLTSAEIAEQLAVTTATVRTHLKNLYPKLGAGDKAGAVAAALRHGLIE